MHQFQVLIIYFQQFKIDIKKLTFKHNYIELNIYTYVVFQTYHPATKFYIIKTIVDYKTQQHNFFFIISIFIMIYYATFFVSII